MLARPFSNWGPTILSQSMKRLMALVMKLFWPDMVQVTLVLSPTGLNVNSVSLTPAKGRMNSRRMRMWSFGTLSVIVHVAGADVVVAVPGKLAPFAASRA